MKSTLWWLGLIFGTLSVVMLIKHGFDYGFAAPLQLTLDYYEQVMHVLFGWAEPGIRVLLSLAESWIGLRLPLAPIWRHFLVVLFFAFVAVGRVRLPHPHYYVRNNATAASVVASVVVAALFVSLIGSLTLSALWPMLDWLVAQKDKTDGAVAATVWTMSVVYAAIFLFDFCLSIVFLIETSRHRHLAEFNERWSMLLGIPGRWIALPFVGGAILFAMLWLFSFFYERFALGSPTISAQFLILVILILLSAVFAYAILSKVKSVFSILANYIGAGLFILVNAGLKLAGL